MHVNRFFCDSLYMLDKIFRSILAAFITYSSCRNILERTCCYATHCCGTCMLNPKISVGFTVFIMHPLPGIFDILRGDSQIGAISIPQHAMKLRHPQCRVNQFTWFYDRTVQSRRKTHREAAYQLHFCTDLRSCRSWHNMMTSVMWSSIG